MTRPSDIPEHVWEWADIFIDEHRAIEDDRELVARAYMLATQAPAPVAGMTERQHQAFDLLKASIGNGAGIPPTMREIADGLGITLSRAHAVVKQLQHRGLITMVPRCPRSIAIVGQVDDVSSAHKNIGVA